MQIANLSPDDELRLARAEVQEHFKPSRCPQCKSTDIIEDTCLDGSLCGHKCGGGSFRVLCIGCGHVIHQSECEESEEV